jgi:hypothetical protein
LEGIRGIRKGTLRGIWKGIRGIWRRSKVFKRELEAFGRELEGLGRKPEGLGREFGSCEENIEVEENERGNK